MLIALSSVAAFPGSPFGTGFLYTFITFIGNPVVALLLGVFLAITLIPAQENPILWSGSLRALRTALPSSPSPVQAAPSAPS